jgi:hypothetical protein
MITLAGVALAGAGLTACSAAHGGPGGATRPTAESSTSPDPEIASIVACYRTHGDPTFPDPVYDPRDGNWHFGTSPGSAPLSTQQACQHLFPQANASPPVPQAQFQQLVKFAECMRANGVPNWPDPEPDGSFGLPPALQTKSAADGHAMTACGRYLPSGGLNVHAVA